MLHHFTRLRIFVLYSCIFLFWLAAAPALRAQTVFALSGNNLLTFNASAPGLILSTTTITGVNAAYTISGMDFRPATGELYALGYNQTSGEARLYTINKTTAVATAVGMAPITLDTGMQKIGFDFNPTVDRIRVTGSSNSNYRLHPVTGALVAVDGDLSFAPTDPNAGTNPSIGAVAYSNSYIGATATTLYNYDDSLSILTTQIPPNNGTLNTVGGLGISLNLNNQTADMDIAIDAVTGLNVAYFVASDDVSFADVLYTINLQTGLATPVGPVGASGIEIDDIAIEIIRNVSEEVTGELVFALASNNNLLSFDSDLPGVIRTSVPVSGVIMGQVLAGMDFRPATGELYALGYNNMTGEARLYTIVTATGVATPVGNANFMLEAGMTKIGFDFNPTVDRIRVTGSNNANYRLHPVTGAIAATDMDLAFAAGDPNAASNPSVGAVAYTNSYIGATTTVLYNYDDSLNVLTTQIPPNNGTLNTVGSTGLTLNLVDPSADLDIFFDTITATNQAYLSANTGVLATDNFYSVNLSSGATTLIGKIGLGISILDIAVQIDRALPEEVTGQLVYALTGNSNLISFDSELPSVIRSLVSVTGLTAGQVLSGMDFRPATGELYGIGYNNTTGEARLYTIDLVTGLATPVGMAAVTLEAGMGKIGFDFNPTVDRIRVTGSNNANYRLHPVTGAIAATDTDLAFAAGDPNAAGNPSIGAVAYTNSFIGTTTTTLYNYDDSLNVLTSQIPPNNGVLNTIGSSGLTLNLADATADLDIYYDTTSNSNLAYLSANTGAQTQDNFYRIDLGTGTATLVGTIGFGIPVNDIAVLIERSVAEEVTGQLVYALTGNNSLITFDSDLPEVVRSLVPVTGVAAGQALVGLDFRPATGELYALGYNNTLGEARLYTIDDSTGVATAIGAAAITLEAGMNKVGFDFNPTVDRIRVTGSNNANYRLHPVTGAIAATDMDLAFAAADVNAGVNPSVGAVAYTNSYIGATGTTLYNYDDSLNVITRQIPPNNGTLNTVGSTGIVLSLIDPSADMDIYFDAESGTNLAFLNANTGTSMADNFYSLDLTTGAATLIGEIGAGVAVNDIALFIERVVPQEVTGQLVYAVTSTNNLISFDSELPEIIRELVPITGIPAEQVLVGTDFRPATGDLIGLGYNATNGEARLYTIDRITGVASPIGAAAVTLALGNGAIGFDFNPTVDRIRVVGANNANYRLHPVTGAIAATDMNLAYAAGDVNAGTNPSIGSAAYTNSFNGTTMTTLYTYDDSLNTLNTQVPPNDGVQNTVGSSGLTVSTTDPTVDIDIFYNYETSENDAYLAANQGVMSNDNFYTLDLASGAATLVGKIGNGIAVRDIAVYIDSVGVIAINDPLVQSVQIGVAPNPTPEQTILSFDLTETAHVRIDVMDITGRRVATLKDEAMQPGLQQVNWNVATLSEGLYLAQIRIDGALRGTAKVIVQHQK